VTSAEGRRIREKVRRPSILVDVEKGVIILAIKKGHLCKIRHL